MEDIRDRVKILREKLGLSQEKFGERIGVKRATICNYEKKERNISDQAIRSICREFNVNENWLLTGEEPMLNQMSEDEELSKYVSELIKDGDQLKKDLILTILKLNEDDWEVIKKIINSLRG